MKRTVVLLFLPFFAVAALSAQDSFTSDLHSALTAIGKSHYQPILVGFGGFSYDYGSLSGSFSRFLEDRIAAALQGNTYLTLFVRNAVSNLDPSFREKFGELLEEQTVQGLIRGRYFDEGSSVRVSLEVVSLVDGSLIGKRDVRIGKNQVPASVSLLPANYDKALAVFKELSDVVESASDDFSVKVTTNRGAGAVFRDGEELTLSLYAKKDAYVKVYHVDVNGTTTLIFPNDFHSDNFLPKDTLLQIPGKGHPFAFLLHEPFGAEYIKVLASTTPFSDIERSFSDLGSERKKVMTRGLSVKQRQGDIAEAMVGYTIVR